MSRLSDTVLAIITGRDIDVLDDETLAQLVALVLEEAKKWLPVAVTGDPTRLLEFKAWTTGLAETAKRRRLSQETQLDAQETARRTERAVGLAVRYGQALGTVRRAGQSAIQTNRHGVIERGKNAEKISTYVFFPGGGGSQSQTYQMTDGITDEQFDVALREAKAEGNLGRPNVIRKLNGEPSPPKAETTEEQTEQPKRRHRTDRRDVTLREARYRFVQEPALRVLADSFDALALVLTGTEGIDPSITPGQAASWKSDLSRRAKSFRQLLKLLEERSK